MPDNVTPVDVLETVRQAMRETDSAIADLKRIISLQDQLIESQRETIRFKEVKIQALERTVNLLKKE